MTMEWLAGNQTLELLLHIVGTSPAHSRHFSWHIADTFDWQALCCARSKVLGSAATAIRSLEVPGGDGPGNLSPLTSPAPPHFSEEGRELEHSPNPPLTGSVPPSP